METIFEMILCDTDVLIEFYKNTAHILQELHAIGQRQLAVSAITQAELYFGALNKVELHKIRTHLQSISRFAIDTMISDKFLMVMETYSLSHKLGLPDAIIAATAIVHHLPLYTLNTKHFQFLPEVELYHPITY
jgi:tRNA(fMet)-specific endonuclease VapC